jgi:NADH-quinone oxidoreductase subunit E
MMSSEPIFRPGYTEKELDDIIQAAIAKHGDRRDASIPIMSEINLKIGYIPPESLGKLRRLMNTPEEGLFLADSQLFSIASFYHMFSLKPTGRHVIRFCESAPCHVMGGRQVIQSLKDQLGVDVDSTTPDQHWTLMETSCLGVCGVGPVFLVDNDIYGNVTPDRVPEILAKYK